MNVDNDTGSLHQAAKSLMVLQGLFGIIPHMFGKGEAARVSIYKGNSGDSTGACMVWPVHFHQFN